MTDIARLPRAGALAFELDGRTISPVAYDQGGERFVPFRDATNGGETYNSYCAYNAN